MFNRKSLRLLGFCRPARAALLLSRLRLALAGLPLLVLGFCTPSALANTPAKFEPLPLEAFYRDRALSDIEISPDGKNLLALKNFEGMTYVIVYSLENGQSFYPIKSDNVEFKFNWVNWANNKRILLSLRFPSRRGTHGTGLTFQETRLLSIDAFKPSKPVLLYKPNEELAKDYGFVSQFQDNVISYLPEDPDNILLSIDRDMPGRQSVYKVNVNSGRMVKVQPYKTTVRSWMADRQGVVRLGRDYDDKAREITFRVLPPNSDKWVDAWKYVNLEEPDISALGFDENPNFLYMLFDKEGRQALYKVDLSKPDFPRELILEDSRYDIEGRLIYSRALKQVVGIYANKTVFFNQEFKAFQKGLDKALPHTDNEIISLSDDGRKYVVRASNVTNPGTLYVGDRDSKSLGMLAADLPELTKEVLVDKEHRHFKARDGLELDGYLSLPKNYSGKPVATIILPHGGPMSEDYEEFDRFSAYLSNRGYAVFQPNYRGSSGRGYDFMMHAVGGYGLEMQDDLEDSVKYLIAEKIADPNNVAIVGASYGGYAALMGATKTPDLFKLAISFAGMSDLVRMRKGFRYYLARNSFREQFGNDKDQLKETSPVRMVDKVKIPILLIHGNKDAIVPVTQSRVMADALKDAHKTYEYVELEDGTHNLDYLDHRKQTFEAMEAFLKKYMPVTI